MHTTYIKIYRKIVFLTAFVARKIDQRDNFIFCLNYVHLILSVFLNYLVLELEDYFCSDLLFIVNKCDSFHMSLTKFIYLVNFLGETCKLSQILLSVLGPCTCKIC
jgi:hypothetical protein